MFMPSLFGENLLDDFFDMGTSRRRKAENVPILNQQIMSTDVKENDKGFELSMNLPGFKKEDVKAELKEGYLTISASNASSNEQKDENGKYIRRERYIGSCSRTFYVGDDITKDDIKARFENGVLTLDIPKMEEKPRVEENHLIEIG